MLRIVFGGRNSNPRSVNLQMTVLKVQTSDFIEALQYKERGAELSFFSVRCIIPLFHPPIGVYTRYFLTLGAIMDFSRVQREKSIIARLEI